MTSNKLKMLLETKINSDNHEIVNQVIYVGVNVATGSKAQKDLIMGSKVFLGQLLKVLQPSSPRDLIIGALWVVINLSWTEDQGYNDRISALQKLGFATAIANLVTIQDADVRERVETALKYISNQ